MHLPVVFVRLCMDIPLPVVCSRLTDVTLAGGICTHPNPDRLLGAGAGPVRHVDCLMSCRSYDGPDKAVNRDAVMATVRGLSADTMSRAKACRDRCMGCENVREVTSLQVRCRLHTCCPLDFSRGLCPSGLWPPVV